MTPLVSILVPAYNAERWIADTIKSALNQAWPRKEIVVVDDGSTDQTLQVARQFASKTVSIVTQENQGASAARNRAFELCQGSYIQWLDADDLLAPDKISKQMEAANECPSKRVLLSSAWGAFMYRVSKAQFSPTSLWCDLSPVEWLLLKMGQNLHMQTATWLVSRELTEAAGPWNTELSLDDDGEYFARVVVASHGIRFVGDAKVLYRDPGYRRLSSVDRSDKKLESQFRSLELQMSHFRGLADDARVRAACLRCLQTWYFWFYDVRADLADELQQLARGLGGQLEVPHVRKKYRWIERIAGRSLARRAQELLPRAKWGVLRFCDEVLLGVEKIGKSTLVF
jgi:glycosyltransferase involved in cell wall biosynthesis